MQGPQNDHDHLIQLLSSLMAREHYLKHEGYDQEEIWHILNASLDGRKREPYDKLLKDMGKWETQMKQLMWQEHKNTDAFNNPLEAMEE